MGSSEAADAERPHIALFPVTTMGHTIPQIDLAHHLLRRFVSITIFTSSLKYPFVRSSLENTDARVQEENGTQNTKLTLENLHSLSSFISLINSIKRLQPHFVETLQTLPKLHNLRCLARLDAPICL